MKYKYSALDKTGNTVNGTIEADNEPGAKQYLKGKGLYPLSIKASGQLRTAAKKKSFLNFGIKQKLPTQLARQLASLLKGSVPLFQALSIILKQLKGEKEKEILEFLKDQVRGGISLSEALNHYPNIFDNLFVHSVRAGETTGALDSILSYQADLLETRSTLKGKIKAALVYPAIMCVVGASVLLFLVSYVVPMVMKIFDRMNQQLPVATRALLFFTHLVNSYFLIFVVITGVGIFGLTRWVKKSAGGRTLWDRFLLKAPVFGALYEMILVGRFAKILGTLLKSGVHMLQALTVVSSTMKNTIVANAIVEMSGMVERGMDLSLALRETGIFPEYVADMVSVGETGGNIEEMLSNIANYYEINASQRIAALTAMVEPLIIVAMGATIAFILVAILLPLFEMNKVLTR